MFIPDPDPDFFTHPGIPDPGVKREPDPGSATLATCTVQCMCVEYDRIELTKCIYNQTLFSYIWHSAIQHSCWFILNLCEFLGELLHTVGSFSEPKRSQYGSRNIVPQCGSGVR
jgi:hypothetical protein